MNDSNIDRRVEARKKVMAFTPVYNLANKSLLGFLGDLTRQGAQIIGEKPLETGTQVMLTFSLPDDLPGVTVKHMDIPAKVMRCEPDKGSKRGYRLGVQFIETSPENEVIIRALLERYHFRYKK